MGPGERLGDYVLEQALGAGGMKRVWRAVDLRRRGYVAVAVLHRFAPAMFRNEVALAQRVDSPHVARVIDGFVTPEGMGVVVSELCDGLDLARWRQANADVRVGDAVAIAAQLARGLCAIHAAHVLHRDVKPANAILTRGGVKVIDFGISLPAIDEHTGVGDSVPPAGTLPYMAPEVVDGVVDARSDAYAFGVSLYELITGALPLPHLGFHSHVQWLIAKRPLPVEVLGERGVDPRVGALVARLCAPEVTRRPYVVDVLDELDALVVALGGVVPDVAVTEPAPVPRFGMPFDGALAGVLGDGDAGGLPRAAPTFFIDVPPVRRSVAVATPDPGRIVIGWPHLPLLALVPDGAGTQVRGYDADGLLRWHVAVAGELRGGLVADLDGDGVGELYVWSAARLWAIDAAGRMRFAIDTPPRAGAMPWDDGAPAPLVFEGVGVGGRGLAIGDTAIDVITREVRALGVGWEGQGDALVDAAGVTGMSCHGLARQRFRGDVGTAAAILTARRRPGFVVAALERVFDGRPSVRLGLWGPGGARVGGGDVGHYALQTAPLEMFDRAQQRSTPLFPPEVAPLAIAAGGGPAEDVVIVPYLVNAPWFGPLLVAFDGTGRERWRERLGALTGELAAPPILVDLDGTGHPQLLWSAGGTLHRRDARTGAAAPAPDAHGTPIAALDLGGRGVLQLILWTPDALHLIPCGRCLPGAIHWLPARGDLWRSGTLGADGLPVGPRT